MRAVLGALAALGLAVAGQACGAGGTPAPAKASLPSPPEPAGAASAAPAHPPELALADAATWEAWRRADEVVLVPRRFAGAVAPLVQHRRSQGHVIALLEIEPLLTRMGRGATDGRALQSAIRALATHTAGELRFVLLVGDTDELPAFTMRKGAYEHHTAKEHQNPYAITREEHAAYPSDDPYATLSDEPGAARLAVGRVPARSVDEVEAFVRKVVAYETAPLASSDQAWRRRVTVYAGNPYFGELADNLIKTIARGILDQDMSYDYDLRFTLGQGGCHRSRSG